MVESWVGIKRIGICIATLSGHGLGERWPGFVLRMTSQIFSRYKDVITKGATVIELILVYSIDDEQCPLSQTCLFQCL
jgi:hypothetical protein